MRGMINYGQNKRDKHVKIGDGYVFHCSDLDGNRSDGYACNNDVWSFHEFCFILYIVQIADKQLV